MTNGIDMNNNIISLDDYRRKQADYSENQSEHDGLMVYAVGHNAIAIDVVEDGVVVVTHTIDGDNVRLLGNRIARAVSDAVTWNVKRCAHDGCGRKFCHLWHVGMVVRGNHGSGNTYIVDGITSGGRVRLRPVGGGRCRYVIGDRGHIYVAVEQGDKK